MMNRVLLGIMIVSLRRVLIAAAVGCQMPTLDNRNILIILMKKLLVKQLLFAGDTFSDGGFHPIARLPKRHFAAQRRKELRTLLDSPGERRYLLEEMDDIGGQECHPGLLGGKGVQ